MPLQLLPRGFVAALKPLRAYLPALALVQQSVIVFLIINSVSPSRHRRMHVGPTPSGASTASSEKGPSGSTA